MLNNKIEKEFLFQKGQQLCREFARIESKYQGIMKKKIFKRDKQCVCCGSSKKELAHIIPVIRLRGEQGYNLLRSFSTSFGTERDVEIFIRENITKEKELSKYWNEMNLIVLCPTCHNIFDSRISIDREKKKTVKHRIREYLKKLHGKDYKQKLLLCCTIPNNQHNSY